MSFNSRRRPRSYAGARVLVTGGASGLGLELTRLLAADGARVLVVDLHAEPPADALPAGVDYRPLDVRSDEGWDEVRNAVEATWGGLDLLVLNAGIAVGGRIEVASMEDWQRIVDINLLGVVRGFRAFVPMMKEAGHGQIVATSSLAGLVHAPGMAAYNAVKAGVVAVVEGSRAELAPFGVGVSAICPSFFRTNLHESLHGKDVELEQSATTLITKAPRSAKQVAGSAYEGMARGRTIILTDPDGRIAWRSKRFSRPVYEAVLTQVGKRLAAGKPPLPTWVERLQQRQGGDRSRTR
ncbi:SDR family NAD(P)-dependent oxidoreductase [Janibacter sp. GS2]|uniref:SDR family NAD(P)-dependent oxidoreductase n=1 Tax=Janibacter sp. GS2 TaxID=3442646 RepID=UPI003EBF165E